jgi:hypothetical protein
LIRPFSFIHSLNSLDKEKLLVGQTQIISILDYQLSRKIIGDSSGK